MTDQGKEIEVAEKPKAKKTKATKPKAKAPKLDGVKLTNTFTNPIILANGSIIAINASIRVSDKVAKSYEVTNWVKLGALKVG